MDDTSSMGENFTDIDLNQEPSDPPVNSDSRFGSLLNDLETTHGRIEERIRVLETITSRARQQQRWRQLRNSLEIPDFSGDNGNDDGVDRVALTGTDNGNGDGVVESSAERGKGCKRGGSDLVAKALDMEADVKKVDKDGGTFYDCNICLEMANDPVLTCCGHLFCWVCFYQVSYVDSATKECPVCKGEVSDNTVIPIYGNGESERAVELESGLKVPPRPKARRVESARQQHFSNGLSQIPVAEALRRIRISIGEMGDQTESGSRGGRSESPAPALETGAVAVRRRRLRLQGFSRMLTERTASLSSLSSALNNAERLVDDLETVINNRFLWSEGRGSTADVGNNGNNHLATDSHSPVVQSDHQLPESSAAISSSLRTTDVPGTVVHIVAMRTSSEINLPPASPSLATRRRRDFSRASNADSHETREARRRRLN